MKKIALFLVSGIVLLGVSAVCCLLVYFSWQIEDNLIEIKGKINAYSCITSQGNWEDDNRVYVNVWVEANDTRYGIESAILAKINYEGLKKNIKTNVDVEMLVAKDAKDGICYIYAFKMDGQEYLTFLDSQSIYTDKRIAGFLGGGVFGLAGLLVLIMPIAINTNAKIWARRRTKPKGMTEKDYELLQKSDTFTVEIKDRLGVDDSFIQALKNYAKEIKTYYNYNEYSITFYDEELFLSSITFASGVAVIEYYLDEECFNIPLSYDKEPVDLGLTSSFVDYRNLGIEKLFEDILAIIHALLSTKAYIEYEDDNGMEKSEKEILSHCQIVSNSGQLLAYTDSWRNRNVSNNFLKLPIK